ncbi:MAG TPA: CHASE3 domain-containing protein [Steroidobacteraceae bacterium]
MLGTREIFRSSLFCLAACVVIIGFAAVVIGRTRDLRTANLQVRAWRDIEVTAERLLGQLRDSETGQRGYLLTQESSYLQPFEHSSGEVLRLTGTLESLTAAVPEQLERARAITALVKLKLEELSSTIELNRHGDAAGALGLVKTNRGKALMDQIRQNVDEIGAAASGGAQAARMRADVATRNLVLSIIITSGLSVLLLMLLTYFLRRDGRRIRETAEQLATTLRSIGDAVVTTDAAGNVTFLNAVAMNLAGVQAPMMPAPFGQLFALVNEGTGERAKDPIEQVLRDGKTIGLANHTALLRSDGTSVSIEDSAAPLRDELGNVRGVVFVFKDISERRRAESEIAAAQALLKANFDQLKATENELRLADRLKDEFLATLAHELRNPVAPIRHAIKLLDNELLGEEQRRWARAVITRQSAHMARLLDDLLDSARITRGELILRRAAVDLRTVITEALDVATPLIDNKSHLLEVILPDQPVTLMVDGIRIAQVLSNLLTNAAKYTDAGGRIEIRAELASDQLLISVKDSGVGLDPAAIPHVFKMFGQVHATLNRSEGGLGIGLALANELIKLHGGRIDVHSDGIGRGGSAFVIVLPLAVVVDRGNPQEPALVPLKRINASRLILIIDDNADAAASLGMLLELAGSEVLIAHTGEAGIDVACQYRPNAIIVDIGLPGINGYEVAETLRKEPWCVDVLLIALTGWGQTDDKHRARAAGFDHHVTKPADPDELNRLIGP